MNPNSPKCWLTGMFPVLCLAILWLFPFPLHAQSDSWPTNWRCETLEDEAGDWWVSLRVSTVPGVLYHLQESTTMAPGAWTTLQSRYGSGAEWICPLFPGSAPQAAAPTTQTDRVVLPSFVAPARFSAFLVLERNSPGGTVVSWRSLDSGAPLRMLLQDVTLDPIWDEFNSFYINAHGSHVFSLSPRLGTPLEFTGAPPVLGPRDSAMMADFIAAIPAMTAHIGNSVTAAATSDFGQRPEPNGARKFFRVAADWGVDQDGDGRYDWQEIILDGNNPSAVDSDGDGSSDTAQDNSGPEPTIESPAPGHTGVVQIPPAAEIEMNTVWAGRDAFFRPNYPEEPLITQAYTHNGVEVGFLKDKATFQEFADAVAQMPLPENGWTGFLDGYTASNSKGEPWYDTDPESALYGSYHEVYSVHRSAFRLKLDSPAPPGGYRIPLRVMRYSIEGDDRQAEYLQGPFTGIGYEDLMLTVAEGETVGTPVFDSSPQVVVNRQMNSCPLPVRIVRENLENQPDYTYRSLRDGVCILPDEVLKAEIWGYQSPRFRTRKIELKWQCRQLRGDGTLAPWVTLNPQMTPEERQQSEPPADLNHRDHAFLRFSFPGIFQFQTVFRFPDGTDIEAPYLRMSDAKAMFNGDTPPAANLRLKAGQPDYLGVCNNGLSFQVREEAMRWLGRTDYSFYAHVPINPGWIFNPSTATKNKCNIFVTHCANRAGATTPYYYRYGFVPSAPIARGDWHLEPEENVNLDGSGWHYVIVTEMPYPGMTAASHGTPSNSGHVGILDYDGSWIGAGPTAVNKFIHLSDSSNHYKPTHFRHR